MALKSLRETSIPAPKIGQDELIESESDRREKLRKSLNVSSLEHTFDNFTVLPGTKLAFDAFVELSKPETDWKLLLCYGGVGNGKTYLLEALAIELYRQGLFCRIYPLSMLMRNLKNAMSKESAISNDELLQRYIESERLLIDDLGAGGSGSDWEWKQFEEIIVERYRARRLTAVTTNLDIKQIPVRIVSRFQDAEIGRVVLNGGGDYRYRRAK